MRLSVRSFSLCLALLSSMAVAADWPNFRGPNHNGISDEKGINKDWKTKPPKELWKIQLGDDGYAGPCVAAGKLFIIDHTSSDDIVRAIDVTNGNEIWKFTYADTSNKNYGFARSTPAFDKGKLYTLSRLGLLHCLDAEKGTVVWSRDIKKDFKGKPGGWDYAGSPFIDGDKLIVCPGGPNASVVALDKNTGKDIWAGGGDDQAGYATPVLATINDKKQYVIFTGHNVIGVDVENGKLIWKFQWETKYEVNAATPLVMGNNVFVTSNYDHGCGLATVQGENAQKVWENKNLQAHFNSPVFADGYIYGIGDPSKLVCLDPKTGNTTWSQPGFGKGGIVLVDGCIIAVNGSGGDVVLVKQDPQKYEELGRIKPLGEQSWTAPIISNGKLFVRNKQALVCLDLK